MVSPKLGIIWACKGPIFCMSTIFYALGDQTWKNTYNTKCRLMCLQSARLRKILVMAGTGQGLTSCSSSLVVLWATRIGERLLLPWEGKEIFGCMVLCCVLRLLEYAQDFPHRHYITINQLPFEQAAPKMWFNLTPFSRNKNSHNSIVVGSVQVKNWLQLVNCPCPATDILPS